MSYLSHAVPTSLPYIRDSVDARSITPVNPTRWFLVPDSTPFSELKTLAVRRCKDRRDLSQRSSSVTTILYDQGLLPQSGFLLVRNAPGRREIISGYLPKLYCARWIHLLFCTCFLFHRLLAASHYLSSKFEGETLPPDGGYSEADGGWNEKQGECLDTQS